MIAIIVLRVVSYPGSSLLPISQLSLVVCGLCGLSVGCMWSDSSSKASALPHLTQPALSQQLM